MGTAQTGMFMPRCFKNRCFKKLALFGICLSFSVVGTVRKSAAQQGTLGGVTKFTDNLEPPDSPQSGPPDSKSLLLFLAEQIHETEMDCSHFVQYLYEHAGLYYGYAPSRILYAGMEPFRRVFHPQAGDLIVWPGHVGIVVDPEEAKFLSAGNSGVRTQSYQSSYWKGRGRPHFLRYSSARGKTFQPLPARKAVPSRSTRSSSAE
jgi:hypothetical protein